MNNSWTNNEFSQVDLNDERLNKRLLTIAERFAESPESTINQAAGNWAESKAAYRFFQNENVDYKNITKSHKEAVKQRCLLYSTFLAIQDTSYFSYTNHPATKGLCCLTKNKVKNNKNIDAFGLIMHSTFTITTDGLPLGIIDQKIYSRPELSDEDKKLKEEKSNKKIPIEEKDSYRWIEAIQNTHEAFEGHPVNIVTICDRECDMYDFYNVANKLNTNVLVRANHNRKVEVKTSSNEIVNKELWDLLGETKEIGTIDIKVPKQKDQNDRIALCSIQISPFALTAPREHIKRNELQSINMYAIYLSEKANPEVLDPIEWMLLTNIPINNLEQAVEKIQWYCLRWRIEVFHKVLKSGLKVEDCRLSTADRLIRYLAIMSVVAWRILWITLVARISPDTSCRLLLDELEWKILYSRFNKNKKLPKKPPTLSQCIIWIACLGGYLARKSDPDPGITNIWRGLKKFSNMLDGADIMRGIIVGNS